MSATSPLFELRGLTAGYGDKQVVREATLEIAEGEIVALLGPNGAGKSTLLSSVLNLTRRFGGEVRFDGEDISQTPTWRFASMGIALVPQGIGVFGEMTVGENLRMARRTSGRDPNAESETEILDLFPVLREKWDHRAASLSGGQRQMVGVARALSARPRLLLLDEPSLGLAPLAVKGLMDAIVTARDAFDLSVILAEQDVGAAAAACSRYYLLKVGRISDSGVIGDGFRERIGAEYLV
jgi:branched-chain amino acid transport system ATP-binding protein